MSRSYSHDEMATPRDPSWDPRDNEHGLHRDEEGQDQGRSGGAENQGRPSAAREVRKPEARAVEPRKPYEYRGRTYALRSSEIQSMMDIGKFRAVDAKDLREFAYGGDSKHSQADLTNLRRQGLIVERQIPTRSQLVALTKPGHRLLSATKSAPKDQALYHGFTKPREAHHDADLYRLYQRSLEKIAREGGTNVRVILDSELKKNLYRDLARAERMGNSGDAKTEIAERHGLRVVRGKIPVPDLRIEYQTSDQEHARVNLELATEHYRFRNIAQKIRANFSIYARAQTPRICGASWTSTNSLRRF
jgi:hypothetical protein